MFEYRVWILVYNREFIYNEWNKYLLYTTIVVSKRLIQASLNQVLKIFPGTKFKGTQKQYTGTKFNLCQLWLLYCKRGLQFLLSILGAEQGKESCRNVDGTVCTRICWTLLTPASRLKSYLSTKLHYTLVLDVIDIFDLWVSSKQTGTPLACYNADNLWSGTTTLRFYRGWAYWNNAVKGV